MNDFKLFYEDDNLMGDPTWPEDDAIDYAKKLGIRFDRRWPDTIFYQFTDKETGNTFVARDESELINNYAKQRKRYNLD